MEIGLSLGSNLGDRLNNLLQAREKILAIPGVSLSAASPVYETEPMDVLPEHGQLSFLNAVVTVQADLDPRALMTILNSVETGMGRKRDIRRNIPRLIDVDMIYAGDSVIRGKDLEVPHPRWSQRRFVVQPLCDVRPLLKIPGESRTVREVLLALPEAPKVIFYAAKW